jgi:hypothetical protein
VTDTLAVNSDGSPLLFTSKAHYLPHLRTIVAGTGVLGFSAEWAMTANNRMAVSGIKNLNYHTPRMLRDIWARYKGERQLPADITTTVYHFGISEGSGEVTTCLLAKARSCRLGRPLIGEGAA